MKKTAQLFKALSEEVRLRILGLLSKGELCVCDLMAVLDLPQSTISRHLSCLTNAGWIAGERRGVWVYYGFNGDGGDMRQHFMPVLIEHLAKCPIAVDDQERLKKYLATKKTVACD